MLAPDGAGGGPSLGVDALKLVEDLAQSPAHNQVSVEQALTPGPQLVDLDGSQFPAPGQVAEDPREGPVP